MSKIDDGQQQSWYVLYSYIIPTCPCTHSLTKTKVTTPSESLVTATKSIFTVLCFEMAFKLIYSENVEKRQQQPKTHTRTHRSYEWIWLVCIYLFRWRYDKAMNTMGSNKTQTIAALRHQARSLPLSSIDYDIDSVYLLIYFFFFFFPWAPSSLFAWVCWVAFLAHAFILHATWLCTVIVVLSR